MPRDRTRLGLTLLLVALLGVAFLYLTHWAARGGETAPLFSVQRYDPYGCAALYELLRRQGRPVHLLSTPRLSRHARGVLLQIVPIPPDPDRPRPVLSTPDEPTRHLDVEALHQWMEAGNRVVQLAVAPTELMDEVGMPHAPADAGLHAIWSSIGAQLRTGKQPSELLGLPLKYAWTDAAHELLPQLAQTAAPPLVLHQQWTLPGQSAEGYRPLAVLGQQTAGAAWQQVGAGDLIVITSPTPALNNGLPEGGNLDLLLALVEDRPIYIDEWSHGLGAGGTVLGALTELGLGPALWQIAFWLTLYAWSTVAPRRPLPPQAPRTRSSAEQVLSLAAAYAQTLTPADFLTRAREQTQRRLAQAWRCPFEQVREQAQRHPHQRRARLTLALLQELDHAHSLFGARCQACGYSLYGLPSATCPECGHENPPEQVRGRAEQRVNLTTAMSAAQRQAQRWLTDSHQLLKESARERQRS